MRFLTPLWHHFGAPGAPFSILWPPFGRTLGTTVHPLGQELTKSPKNHFSRPHFRVDVRAKNRSIFRCLFEGAFGRLGSTFGSEKEAKLLQNGGQNGARWRVKAKLQNIDLGLYIPRFGEVGHPQKHIFLTTFFGVGRDPVPRGLREATFLDFYDFGIHYGRPFSQLFSIIFQALKRGPEVFPKRNLVEHTFGLEGNRGEHPTYGNHPSLCKAMHNIHRTDGV